MAGSLYLVQEFLHGVELDEVTRAYLCDALDGCLDLESSELREFLEPYLTVKDVDLALELLLAISPRREGSAASDASLLQAMDTEAKQKAEEEQEEAKHVALEMEEESARGQAARRHAARVSQTRCVLKKSASQLHGAVSHGAIALDDEIDVCSEGCDLGSLDTYSQEAGTIDKGDHVMIKDHPCRVEQISTSKVWKGPYRGCFQSQMIARCIFTRKKFKHICPASQNIDMPFVKRDKYTVIDIGCDGELSLLTSKYDTKVDVNLPMETDADRKLTELIKTDFNDGKIVVVIVLSACGTQKVVQHKAAD